MRWTLLSVVALAMSALRLPAQTAFDLSIGVGRGMGGGAANDRTLLALDATLARTMRPLGSWAIPVALGAHATPSFGGTACIALPGAGCRQYPNLASVALLSGWSRHADFTRGPRLLAGPAIVWNDGTSSKGLGVMLRADFAESLGRHAALVFGAQSLIAPAWRGERMATASATVGVRLR